jgi:predicted dehydrogenase
MKKLRIGMVGFGFISDWHLTGFKDNPDAGITGMCHVFFGNEKQRAVEMELLKKKCSGLGIKAYNSFESIVYDPEIDALIIGSINPYHFEQIKAAIANRKHIMVEKPVVTDFKQLEEIKRLSAEKGIKIFPAHNFVYRNAVRKAKEIIEAGKLGQIIHSSFIVTHTISETHATGWRANKEIARGGALIDSGHHLIYQALYLLGKPSKLHGFKSNMVLKNMDCEDTAQVSLIYPDGSMSVIMQSWTSNHAEMINGIRIFGTQGSIVISDALYFNDEKIDSDVEYAGSFVNQAKAFSNYILKDIPPVSGLEDVHDTLKITFGAYHSADTDTIINFRTM